MYVRLRDRLKSVVFSFILLMRTVLPKVGRKSIYSRSALLHKHFNLPEVHYRNNPDNIAYVYLSLLVVK